MRTISGTPHFIAFFCTISILFLILQFPALSQTQDSISTQNILVVEKPAKHKVTDTLTGGSLKAIHQRYFKKGDRVAVVKYDDDKKHIGKIDTISDSSIILKKEEINIADIKKISAYRGVEIATAGASTVGVGFTLLGLFTVFYTPKYDEDGDEYSKYGLFNRQMASFMITFAGCITSFVGILQVATVKHYKMDKGYKLTVKQKEKKVYPIPSFY